MALFSPKSAFNKTPTRVRVDLLCGQPRVYKPPDALGDKEHPTLQTDVQIDGQADRINKQTGLTGRQDKQADRTKRQAR